MCDMCPCSKSSLSRIEASATLNQSDERRANNQVAIRLKATRPSRKRNLCDSEGSSHDEFEFPFIQWHDSGTTDYYSAGDQDESSSSIDYDPFLLASILRSNGPATKRQRGLVRSQKLVAELDSLSQYCDGSFVDPYQNSCLVSTSSCFSLLQRLHI